MNNQSLKATSGAGKKKNSGWQRFLRRSLLFVLFLWYQEFVFHLMYFGWPSLHFIYPLLFTVPLGGVTALMTGLFPKPAVNRTLTWIFLASQALLFSVQAVYYSVFKSFLSWGMAGEGGNAITNFIRDVLRALLESSWRLLLFAVPLILTGILMKQKIITCKKAYWPWSATLAVASLAAHVLALISLFFCGTGHYTPYDRYYKTWVLDSNISEFGLLTTTRLEWQGMLFGHTTREEILTPSGIDQWINSAPASTPDPASQDPTSSEPAVDPIDTSPNIMDIDFTALIAGETNKTVKELHQYFAALPGTRKNKYTGMFKDYNLIMICAESLSPYAIFPDLTPTLYRMTQEGFVFNNFYTMYPAVTTNGEYSFCTGLIPDMSRAKTDGSFSASQNNWLPFCMGHQFNALGYTSRAYHDYIYTYYDRNKTHPNMGYIFRGSGGKGGMKFTNNWPLSDIEMMEQTIPEYIGDEKFHTYYMTVSGHLAYRFNAGNEMADKNQAAVEAWAENHPGVKKNALAYLACNLEFENSMTLLLERLEAAGVADRTVIAITTDHYPYGLHLYEYSQLSGFTVDEAFGKYKNTFILWNPAMEPVTIDDPCCTVDILPTLSNLFGLTYDSRLMMGRDILSDSMPIAILSNQSFITDRVMFDSSHPNEPIVLTDEPLPDGYLDAMIDYVKTKFTVSTAMLNTDYYSYVIPRPAA